jgi:hypothetical protein
MPLEQIEQNAPPPLSAVTHIVVSPANEKLRARQATARKLSLKDGLRLRAQRAALSRQLGADTLETLRARLPDEDMQTLELMEHALDEELGMLEQRAARTGDDLSIQAAPLEQELVSVRQKLAARRYAEARLPIAEAVHKIDRRLAEHRLAAERERAESDLMKAMAREVEIYRSIIVDTWTRLGFRHVIVKNGKEKTKRVQFSEAKVTVDAIYFKIDTSYQTAFKTWKTNLPDGIKVADDLLSESTLTQLTITCQRQVTAVYNARGAWVIVHRLNSVDGLLEYVQYQTVMKYYRDDEHSLVPVPIGVGTNRTMQWITLHDYPHWLIGGYTNSGKSNMANVFICTLISRHKPADLRVVMIDLKGGLEFSYYEGIPHLHGKIVDDVEQVATVLAEMEALMLRRFERFRGIAKNIEEYHARKVDHDMPRVVIFFDEVATIMDNGETTKRILASMRQLAAKGRAVGIHLILCTQRPDTKAVDGSIKVNLNGRISGRFNTSADSVTVFGNSAAKSLAAIPGRMMLQISPDPQPVQTPHIADEDIVEALRIAKSYPAPPPLDIPRDLIVIHQQWTVERVIELAIKHLDGNIGADAVWRAATDDLSQNQARKLVERVWKMAAEEGVMFDGTLYKLQKLKGKQKRLTPADQLDSLIS